jgi:hypothetical protein
VKRAPAVRNEKADWAGGTTHVASASGAASLMAPPPNGPSGDDANGAAALTSRSTRPCAAACASTAAALAGSATSPCTGVAPTAAKRSSVDVDRATPNTVQPSATSAWTIARPRLTPPKTTAVRGTDSGRLIGYPCG